MNRVLLVVCVGLAMACGSEVVCPDGTDLLGGACVADDGGADVCRSDDECSDGLFCTGVERCNPTSEAADARGCVVGERPCPGAGCVESTRTCDESCPDADGDGYADAACGGDDCDDGNPRIHPGAVEVCYSAGVDEDCDPSTLGPDRDGDGYIGVECCNLQPNGELHCGTDCDDTMANVHPSAPEVCNGIDDDCDGLIDEGVTTTYYRDLDGDNYGNPEVTIQACSPPSGWTILCCDCNDEDPRVNPAATELCMPPGVDEDCDGAIDEGCDCTFMGSRTCGPGAPHAGVGVCRDGTQTCSAAGTLSECVGGVFPTAEVCDGLDNDCDGRVDEGFPCQRNEMVAGTTSCGRPGFRRCDASCNWLDDTFYAPAETVSSCDYCADTLGGHDAESPHLVSRTSTNLRSGTTGHQFFGDANCTYQYGSCYSLSLHQRDRIDAAVLVDGRGAFFRDEPIDIGYGPMVVSVSVRPRGRKVSTSLRQRLLRIYE
ncbi:MAG: putative metal-binding motif-containing protein, partial [Myxococcales bacterium]|nr:putative metal-binding motif-containing protein [Myxococcales bacterium]